MTGVLLSVVNLLFSRSKMTKEAVTNCPLTDNSESANCNYSSVFHFTHGHFFTFCSKIKFFTQHGKFVAYQVIWARKCALAFVIKKIKKRQKMKTYYTAYITLSTSEQLHYNFPIIISSLPHWTNLVISPSFLIS